MEDMNTAPGSSRLLLWMGVALVALVVLATAITLLRGPAEFEPGTPEAVVQAYIEAVLDEDPDDAWELLTPRLQGRCDPEDLEPRYRRARQGGITLIETRERENTAVVELEFNAASDDGPFDVYEYSYRERFDLRLVDGEWRVSDVPWPFDWWNR